MGMMLVVTFTALIQKTVALVKNVASGQAAFLVDGLQLIVAVLLMVLGVMVAYSCIRKLFGAGKNSEKRGSVIQQKIADKYPEKYRKEIWHTKKRYVRIRNGQRAKKAFDRSFRQSGSWREE